MAITLEAVYENVRALEAQVERLDDRFEHVENLLSDTRGELREISAALRTRAEYEAVERERIKSLPERLSSVETTMKANAETLRAVLEGTEKAAAHAHVISRETRDAWIGQNGFFQSTAFRWLFGIVLIALLVLVRAVDPATVTTWLSALTSSPSVEAPAPARVEGLSESQ